jgi:hypothetical protein
MNRRHVGHPAAPGGRLRLPEGLDELVHGSDVREMHARELLSLEGGVFHLFDHGRILAAVRRGSLQVHSP